MFLFPIANLSDSQFLHQHVRLVFLMHVGLYEVTLPPLLGMWLGSIKDLGYTHSIRTECHYK